MNEFFNRFAFFSTCFLLLPLSPFSQEIRFDRIDFQESPSWEKVLDQAKRSGKLIFFDAYTTWCAPCKKMEKEVFTQSEVANYFNQKFINVKYDMEKGEGLILKKEYNISAFPTYLFINANGRVVHRILGARTREGEFLKYSKMAATPGQSYSDLEQRYRNGERNPDLIQRYLEVLQIAGEQSKAEEISRTYLALMTEEHFMDKTYWEAAKLFLKDPYSREFKLLLQHREKIATAIGEVQVYAKIYQVIDHHISQKNQLAGSGILADKNEEAFLINFLRESDFARRNELLARLLAAHYAHHGEWYDYACTVDAMLDFRLLDGYHKTAAEFDHHARTIYKIALDPALLKKALRWSQFACMKEPSSQQYLLTQAQILEKLGQKTESELIRKKANASH